MTSLKIKGFASAAQDALEPHVRGLYDNNAARLLFVGELQHVMRTEPGPASDTMPSVTVRISQLEVPGQAQQNDVRELMRALFLLRTADGTLDAASGQVNLDAAAAKVAEGASVAYVVEALEARAALRQAHLTVAQLADDLTTSDVVRLRRKLRKLAGTLEKFIATGATIESLLPEFVQAGPDGNDPAAGDSVEVDIEVSGK